MGIRDDTSFDSNWGGEDDWTGYFPNGFKGPGKDPLNPNQVFWMELTQRTISPLYLPPKKERTRELPCFGGLFNPFINYDDHTLFAQASGPQPVHLPESPLL
ncbi:hypothetical protein STEG23_024266, partial [Scotinomys teguina]